MSGCFFKYGGRCRGQYYIRRQISEVDFNMEADSGGSFNMEAVFGGSFNMEAGLFITGAGLFRT
jgi:anti-sigma regulatory factor (Ser/Thr protein kinase)